MLRMYVLVILGLVMTFNVQAEVIQLLNGDQLTGKITSASESELVLQHELFGDVTIPKDKIITASWKIIHSSYKEAWANSLQEKQHWKGNVSFGYSFSKGTSNKQSWNGRLLLKRTYTDKVHTLKWDQYQLINEGHKEEQKWSALLEQINPLEESQWFTSYQLGADHDRFANINYRLIPSLGIGYHWIDTDKTCLRLRTSAAWQLTNFYDNTDSKGEFILVPGLNVEMVVCKNATLVFDAAIYPSFDRDDGYRVKAELSLITPISNKMSFKLSVIEEYDSNPRLNAFENDIKLNSSLVYHI